MVPAAKEWSDNGQASPIESLSITSEPEILTSHATQNFQPLRSLILDAISSSLALSLVVASDQIMIIS